MSSRVRIIDNRAEARRKLDENIEKALFALGFAVVETVINYMQANYGNPIFDTGTLIRSITFDVDLQAKKVFIGTNIDYSIFVHNGTSRMRARPFLLDAVTENVNVWKEIIAEKLGQGWKFGIKS